MEEKYSVYCPSCGRLLSKSGNGTNSEMTCPKCKADLSLVVAAGRVSVEVIKPSPKKKSA